MNPQRPNKDEYLAYYERYISLVPDGDITKILSKELEQTLKLLHSVSEEKSAHRYAEGKWSLKQVLGHMVDAERIFAYRALSIARDPKAILPGMEPDDWENASNSDSRKWAEMLEEFELLRKANVAMLHALGAEAWQRAGTASNATVSVRAMAYIMAGHELHHRAIIQNKYL